MPTYQLAPAVPPDVAEALHEHTPVVQQLLVNRNITDKDAAAAWLNPPYEAALNDPQQLPGMATAVERIVAAIANDEPVVIYSDYDCDGIPGAVVLHDFFTEVGFTNFSVYIPHRHYEGFGFNEAAANKLAAEGAKLIITIDCGTNDVAAVAAANAAGVDVIITDHHQATGDLPTAVAVVNPALDNTYPWPHLCGAGVVFKLVQALLATEQFDVLPGREKWWLDMVGLATVADMVPLRGENRTLAHYGLTVLRKSRRPGLQALLKAQRASQANLTEDDIGFIIGPRINAASRMGEPLRAFKLLTATSDSEAAEHVAHLEQLNNERKGAVAAMTRAAHKKLTQHEEVPAVIVVGDPEWRPSLVGLVANKLAEEHARPAFVWGRDGNGVIKGSCRNGSDTSLVALMQAAASSFIEYGGHHASGGFSVTDDAIHTLAQSLQTAHQALDARAAEIEPMMIDAVITTADLSLQVLREVLALGPFGVDNPKPLFRLSGVVPQEVGIFGKTKEHTKLVVPTLGRPMDAIAFFKTPEQFSAAATAGEPCDLLVQPEQSYFMGRLQYRLRLIDILKPSNP